LLEPFEIKEFLREARFQAETEVRIRPIDGMILLYVNRDQVADKLKPGFTSLRQLRNIQKAINNNFSATVEVILALSDSHLELESAFHQLLNKQFKGQIISLYMSFRRDSLIDTWIELARSNEQIKADVIEVYNRLLNDVSLCLGRIYWINSLTDLPTTPFLLRVVKIEQPVVLDRLVEIVRENYQAVDERWIRHKFDKLRKKELIIRGRSGYYALTQKALNLVPTSYMSSSSDVDRALALGRRKW